MYIFTLRLTRKLRTKKFSVGIFLGQDAIRERNKRYSLSVLFTYVERLPLSSPDKFWAINDFSLSTPRRLFGRVGRRVEFSSSQSRKWPNAPYSFADSKVLEFLSRLRYAATRSIFYTPVTTATTTSCRVCVKCEAIAVLQDGRAERGSGSRGRK